MKKVKYLQLSFHSMKLNTFDVPKFRGFIADEYENYDLIHNHLSNNKLRYSYPKIQFKIIDKVPTIIALEDGVDVIRKVFLEIDEIRIEEKKIRSTEKSIIIKSSLLGVSDKVHEYHFLTPWMALNQDNCKKYVALNKIERQEFLEKILVGNFKSLCKGCDYWIKNIAELKVRSCLKPVSRNFKNIKMNCFTGSFQTNFNIPVYLGLGKQTARGFGCVGII